MPSKTTRQQQAVPEHAAGASVQGKGGSSKNQKGRREALDSIDQSEAFKLYLQQRRERPKAGDGARAGRGVHRFSRRVS